MLTRLSQRDKHLKCDGQTPCSRCRSARFQCIYVPSRRGARAPRNAGKRARSSESPEALDSSRDSCPLFLGAPSVSIPASTLPGFQGFSPSVGYGDTPTVAHSSSPSSVAQTPTPETVSLYRNPFAPGADSNSLAVATSSNGPPAAPATSLGDKCFDAFYHYFHAAHPFILPRQYFLELLSEGVTNLEHVVAAMRYIGSLFLEVGPSRATFLEQALRLCSLPSTPKDGFLVQALLILIVGLDGNCEQAKARELLADCERIALEIHLNTRQFAAIHGRNNPVLEESWRRTWWDLYVCDGMVAGVHRITNFALFDIEAAVGLPCEEIQYATGVCILHDLVDACAVC